MIRLLITLALVVTAYSAAVSFSGKVTVTGKVTVPEPIPFTPPPVPTFDADLWINFETGTVGQPYTVLNLPNATVGGPVTWGESTIQPIVDYLVTADGHQLSEAVKVGGVTYDDATGSRCLSFSHDENDNTWFSADFPSSYNNLSISFYFKTTLSGALDPDFSNYDLVILTTPSGADYLVLQWRHGQFRAHGKRSPPGGTLISLNQNQWYRAAMQWNRSGTGYVSVYNADTEVLVGTSTVPIGDTPCNGVQIGTDNHGTDLVARTWYDNFVVDWTDATHPLGL